MYISYDIYIRVCVLLTSGGCTTSGGTWWYRPYTNAGASTVASYYNSTHCLVLGGVLLLRTAAYSS